MEQDMLSYSKDDSDVWTLLFKRQVENLQTKGSQIYLDALEEMSPVLNGIGIPDFSKMNSWFESSSGWQIEVVPGLIPVDDFFILLSKKKFCSSTWLRSKENLDYLEAPDMFHDIFGHVPLLSDPVFSEFMEAFGKLGVKYIDNRNILLQLQRLYWFTIEFGVIKEEKINAYGAGIISSFGETNAVAEGKGNFLSFDIHKIINLPFRTDQIQENYFIITSFQELFDSLNALETLFLKQSA